MTYLKCMVLCLSWFVVGSSASAVAPFIEPCRPSDSKCMVKSATNALPFFIKGIESINVPPLGVLNLVEPIHADSGDMKLTLLNMVVTGTSQTEFVNIERDFDAKTISLVVDIPISIDGEYIMGGKITAVNVEGKGNVKIHTNKLRVTIDIKLKTFVDKDGNEHYDVLGSDYKYELLDKVSMKFENLYNGDKAQAEPVQNLIDQNSNDLFSTFAGPVVKVAIRKILEIIKIFLKAVANHELQIV